MAGRALGALYRLRIAPELESAATLAAEANNRWRLFRRRRRRLAA